MPHPTRAPALPIERIVKRMVRRDPILEPYADSIRRRLSLVDTTQKRLTGGRLALADFAAGHEYFGLHLRGNQWVFREWAPNATRIFLVGDATGWKEAEPFALTRKNEDGVWELRLPKKSLRHGDLLPPAGPLARRPGRPHPGLGPAGRAGPRHSHLQRPGLAPGNSLPVATPALPTQSRRTSHLRGPPGHGSGRGENRDLGRVHREDPAAHHCCRIQHHPAHGRSGAPVLRLLRLPGVEFLRRQFALRDPGAT